MRIISQDRRLDFNYNDIVIQLVRNYEYTGEHEIQCIYQTKVFDLGIYCSKERALEVMKEIRNNYVLSENFRLMNDKGRDLLIKVRSEINSLSTTLEKFAFYEMPKE